MKQRTQNPLASSKKQNNKWELDRPHTHTQQAALEKQSRDGDPENDDRMLFGDLVPGYKCIGRSSSLVLLRTVGWWWWWLVDRAAHSLSSSSSSNPLSSSSHVSRCRQNAESSTDFTKRTCRTWHPLSLFLWQLGLRKANNTCKEHLDILFHRRAHARRHHRLARVDSTDSGAASRKVA
jgi:hypothetical protein